MISIIFIFDLSLIIFTKEKYMRLNTIKRELIEIDFFIGTDYTQLSQQKPFLF